MFAQDLADHWNAVMHSVVGSRILVLGAAGSIGSAFVRQLIPFHPGSLHLVDINENNLVEVVRDLRSSLLLLPEDFRTFPVAMGSEEFEKLIGSQRPYDYIFNFSAMKHVRSEKDPYSLMRMYNTNVYFVKRLLDALEGAEVRKFFSVSSDKAANPASIMGATKAFMERILLAHAERIPFSSARFANVVFSDGSLLHGFLQRLEKNQPFSAPCDVRRCFISLEEAGQLCLLACFLGENRDIFFPKLDEDKNLLTFSEVAELVLESYGFSPDPCASEQEAKQKAARMKFGSKRWPCYFFESDTTGEKAFEEFFTLQEQVDLERYRRIGIISRPSWTGQKQAECAMAAFEKIRGKAVWRKEDMVEAIRIIVPELKHDEKNRNLDQKM